MRRNASVPPGDLFSSQRPSSTNLVSNPFFSAPMKLPGQGFFFTALADLNGDGNLDLAGVRDGAGQLAILLGNGDGTFNEPLITPVGTRPFAVVTGDFNSDGILDLAVTNQFSFDVSILLGNGDGSFGPENRFPVRRGESRFAVAVDLTGDGFTHLAVAQRSNDSISFLVGHGDGTFEPFTELSTDLRRGWRILATDIDGDGFLDLVLGTKADRAFSILGGHGDGTFDLPRRISTSGTTPSIVAVDFNGDGVPDFAHSDPLLNDRVAVLLASQDGPIGSEEFFDFGGNNFFGLAGLAAGDFNLDGLPDLAASSNSVNLTLLVSAGNGNFIVTAPLLIQTLGTVILSDDLNKDGRDDLTISPFYFLPQHSAPQRGLLLECLPG
ncbi:MAG: FG-GAP repeat domain-containing protein [Acidobacteriota bacterium]